MANVSINNKVRLIPPEAILRFQGGLTYLIIANTSYTVILTAAGSNDPDGTISTYIWSRRIDGGAWTQIGSTTVPSFSQIINVTGVFEYKVTVIDNTNLSDESNIVQIDFTASASLIPIAYINGSENTVSIVTEIGLTTFLDGIDSIAGSDIDTIVAYSWEEITQPSGNYTITNGSNFLARFRANVAGLYTLELEVTNQAGLTDTNRAFITVN